MLISCIILVVVASSIIVVETFVGSFWRCNGCRLFMGQIDLGNGPGEAFFFNLAQESPMLYLAYCKTDHSIIFGAPLAGAATQKMGKGTVLEPSGRFRLVFSKNVMNIFLNYVNNCSNFTNIFVEWYEFLLNYTNIIFIV